MYNMYHILLFNHSLTATLMKNRNLKEKLNWLHSHRVNNEIKKIFSFFFIALVVVWTRFIINIIMLTFGTSDLEHILSEHFIS